MFITAADIGKFLSETLLRFVSSWNRMVHKIKVTQLFYIIYYYLLFIAKYGTR